jgi:pyridoxal phosphate enzyme (YggS family)
MSLEERIREVRSRLTRACELAGRDPASVELLPVSKFQPEARLREALALGFHRFGENYVQEAAAKAGSLPEATFVLLGPLQSNKAKLALGTFAELQSVDRLDLAHRLARLAGELELIRPVWVQVDLWAEATKLGGCPEAALPALLEYLEACPRLPLKGFMALPPPGELRAFVQMAELREVWRQRLGRDLKLSMGMSGDLEAAVAAGTDQVRIGTAFFGER